MRFVSMRGIIKYGASGGISLKPFFVRSGDAGEYALVTVGGELDIATAPELRACISDLAARGHARFVLDVKELEFIDALGLSALVAAYMTAQRRDGWLCLVHVHPRVHKVMHLV